MQDLCPTLQKYLLEPRSVDEIIDFTLLRKKFEDAPSGGTDEQESFIT